MDVKEVKMGGRGLDSSGSGQGSRAVVYEHNNDPSGSINYWEFLD
jgi:hypothetical protein